MLILALLVPFLGTTATLCLVVFAALATIVYKYVKNKQSHWEKKGVKYVKPKFLLGHMKIFFRSKSIAEAISDLYYNFSGERYLGIYQFTLPTLMIKDPELIKQITIKDFDHFLNHRSFVSAESDAFWSKNLFASRDKRWRDLRTTLSPSFTSSKMKIMYNLIDECAQQFVQYFKNQNKDIVEFEVKDTLRRYTNDVIATTAFGIKCDSLQNPKNGFYLTGKDASNFSGLRMLRFFVHAISPTLCKLLGVKIIPEKVSSYFSKIITDTVRTRKEEKIVRPDMIHLLMEAQKERQDHKDNVVVNEGFSSAPEFDLNSSQKEEITIEDISSQAFIFFFAGFDTVSTFLTFAFYEIAVNPEIQKRLRKEIQSVSGKVTYDTLLGLKYLDMVVSEVLRKWPPVIVTDREVSKDYTIEPKNEDKPLFLEKGTICWLPVFAVHNDPQYYPDPKKFDPERFNDENKQKINPSTYFPFGAGPRNCIGSRFALLEGKLIIFHVLKNFELVRVGKTQYPLVLDKSQFNLAPKDGLWLGLKKL